MKNGLVLWRLLKLFKPYWGWMALGIFISLITLLANVGLLALSGWFIAAMALAGLAHVDINYFTPSATIRGLAIARISSRYGERIITHEATFRLLAQLRRWFYEKLEPLSPAILQSYQSGDLLSRIRADIDTLENFYLRILSPVVVAAMGTLVFVLFLSHYHPLLALAEAILLFMAGVALPLIINRLSQTPGKRMVETTSQLRTSAIDSMQGMGELLIYNAARQQDDKLKDLTEKLLTDQQQMANLNGLSLAGLGFFANLAMGVMLIIAIPLVSQHQLAPPLLAMLVLFALASFEAVMALPLALQLLPETIAAARRIFQIADSQPLITDPDGPTPTPTNHHIQFSNVDFRYLRDVHNRHDLHSPENPPWVLKNFHLDIPEGSKLGIIGPSGAGKSSIVNILLRFWPIQNGQITLGGIPLEHYPGDAIRQHFSVVSQHTHLFNSTIRANLLLANPQATEAQINAVCTTAQIHDFIQSLPDGYDTWIGEAGTKLSGGQAQRLAIARALLKDAPILILDEPFEGLDPLLEQQLINAIIPYCEKDKQKTLIYITHKKAGLKKMDQIVIL